VDVPRAGRGGGKDGDDAGGERGVEAAEGAVDAAADMAVAEVSFEGEGGGGDGDGDVGGFAVAFGGERGGFGLVVGCHGVLMEVVWLFGVVKGGNPDGELSSFWVQPRIRQFAWSVDVSFKPRANDRRWFCSPRLTIVNTPYGQAESGKGSKSR
jgi:hypothetical protein